MLYCGFSEQSFAENDVLPATNIKKAVPLVPLYKNLIQEKATKYFAQN